MEKGPIIGRGRTVEIFTWKDNQVLKLFLEGFTAEGAERELVATQVAYDAGMPVPATERIVEVDGRWGIVFERVDGPIMLEDLLSRPWKVVRYAQVMAELHAEMYSCEVAVLPSLREDIEGVVRNQARLPGDVNHILIDALKLTDGNSLLHGDLHPENIIMSPRGPVIIDWRGAKRGNPLADVTRTWFLLRMSASLPDTKRQWLINSFRWLFCSVYMKHYRRLHVYSEQDLTAWRLPVVALRLELEPITEERQRLLAYIDAHIR